MSWRKTITSESAPAATRKPSWRDTIAKDEPAAEPVAPHGVLEKLRGLPEGIANTAGMATDYLGKSIRGEIPLSEQAERLGTAARGASDIVQSIGDLPALAIGKLTGTYDGAGAKPTGKLLESLGLADAKSLEAKDAKYPGARAVGQTVPQLALGGGGVAANVAAGGLGSAGAQLSDKGKIDAGDLVFDSALNAAIPAGAKGAGALAKKAAPVAARAARATGIQAARVMTGLPTDTIERYATRNAAVRNARPLEEIATDTVDAVKGVAKRVSQGSGESGEILARENVQIPTDEILATIESKIAERRGLGAYTAEAEREISQLEDLRSRLLRERRSETVVTRRPDEPVVTVPRREVVVTGTGSAKKETIRQPDGMGGYREVEIDGVSPTKVQTVRREGAPIEKAPGEFKVETVKGGMRSDPLEFLGGKQAKEFLKQVDGIAYPQQGASDITPRLARDFQDVRRVVDTKAKDLSPAFRSKMAEVAGNAKLLERLETPFKSEESAYGTLNRIARERAPFRDRTLKDLGEAAGRDFSEEARDAMAKDAFSKPSVNGSRNVQFLRDIPVIGPVLGYAADYAARPGVAKAIDLGVAMRERLARSSYPAAVRRVLQSAAERGPQALLATHQMLMKTNAEYRSANEQNGAAP